MTFSETNTLLLLKYADEACWLAVQNASYSYTNLLLPRMLTIKDVQIRPLLEQNLLAKEKRQRFYDSKTCLERNLRQCFR